MPHKPVQKRFQADAHYEKIRKLYNYVGDKEHRLLRLIRLFDFLNIALSVLTAGGFWALLGERQTLKEPIALTGALIGTLLLVLQLYQASKFGPQNRRAILIKLYGEIGNELARLAAQDPSNEEEIHNAMNGLKIFLMELHRAGYRSPLVE
jgi:hypothetical protein